MAAADENHEEDHDRRHTEDHQGVDQVEPQNAPQQVLPSRDRFGQLEKNGLLIHFGRISHGQTEHKHDQPGGLDPHQTQVHEYSEDVPIAKDR